MLTQLICSKCDEAVTVTSRSTILPFVCDRCLKAKSDFISECNAKEPQIVLTKACPCCTDDHVPGSELPPIECDTASVENTTRLIADLEKQAAQGKKTVDILKADIRNGTAENERLQKTIGRQAETIKTLQRGNDNQIEEQCRIISGLEVMIKKYAKRLEDANNVDDAVVVLAKETADALGKLMEKVRTVTSTKNLYKSSFLLAYDANVDLKVKIKALTRGGDELRRLLTVERKRSWWDILWNGRGDNNDLSGSTQFTPKFYSMNSNGHN